MLTSRNPATGDVVATYTEHADAEAAAIVERAHAQHREWRRTSFAERATVLRAVADELETRREALAVRMTEEMGKTLAGGRAEVDKCAWACRHYADHAADHLADVELDADRTRTYIHHEPLGVVLAVMPWNFPLWQVFRFAAPALMAGNAAVLKHASSVTGCALDIEDLFRAGGAPEGLFATLKIGSGQVEAVIGHDLVRAVTLTGSVGAGRAVAAVAGQHLKKVVLELGGSDPYVVLADADLDAAVETCVTSRMLNAGQSCIAAKRFVVVDEVHDDFVERFVARMGRIVMGDPTDEASDLGPQAQESLRDELHDQVERAIADGARLVLGGEVPDRPGAWYPPTVLVDVSPDSVAGQEELFGPVAAILRADDEAHAIEIANHTTFGLGAAVFTADVARGERIAAEELDAGCCFVNDLVASDPRLPFGGIKDSGFGRELSHLGIREFVNAKTVAVGPRRD